MSTEIATVDEAKAIKFCTACGRTLIEDDTVEYDRETGKRLAVGRIKYCPNRKGEPGAGHDLWEIVDDDEPAEAAAE